MFSLVFETGVKVCSSKNTVNLNFCTLTKRDIKVFRTMGTEDLPPYGAFGNTGYIFFHFSKKIHIFRH